MAIPIQAIERLFERLQLAYGSEFSNKWGSLNPSEVKSHWAHELSQFSDNLNAIGWALQNLPDRCPNLIEFKSLVKQAPRPTTIALDAPKASVDVVDREMAKIASQAFKSPRDEKGQIDHKQWAKKLMQRHKKGEQLGTLQVNAYKNALGVTE